MSLIVRNNTSTLPYLDYTVPSSSTLLHPFRSDSLIASESDEIETLRKTLDRTIQPLSLYRKFFQTFEQIPESKLAKKV